MVTLCTLLLEENLLMDNKLTEQVTKLQLQGKILKLRVILFFGERQSIDRIQSSTADIPCLMTYLLSDLPDL